MGAVVVTDVHVRSVASGWEYSIVRADEPDLKGWARTEPEAEQLAAVRLRVGA